MEELLFTADCVDMNESGAGIVKRDGMVVFVPGLVPGDRAEIRITRREKNYALGECETLLTESPDRITPECPLHGLCGGCSLGHVSFERENAVKENVLRQALRRAGLSDVPVSPILSGARTGYRNKLTLHFGRNSEGEGFGMVRGESDEVLPFSGCMLAPPILSEIPLWLNAHPALISPLFPAEVRVIKGDDGIVVFLRCENPDRDALCLLESALKETFPEILGVTADFVADRGGLTVSDSTGGLELRFTPDAFRQVNSEVFGKILSLVSELAGKKPFSSAVDLFCGSGVIGISLAKTFPKAKITGVEINPAAVEDAKKNAARNGLLNIRFHTGDAASFRKRLPENAHPGLVVVDPPRAGLSPSARKEIAALAPERVIYISCNPQTLARDLAAFRSAGYGVDSVTPVNQFPMTKHTETICLLHT